MLNLIQPQQHPSYIGTECLMVADKSTGMFSLGRNKFAIKQTLGGTKYF